MTDRLEEHVNAVQRVSALRIEANGLARSDASERIREFARRVVLMADVELRTLGRLIGAGRAELADSGVLACARCGSATDRVLLVAVDASGVVRPLCAECRLADERRA